MKKNHLLIISLLVFIQPVLSNDLPGIQLITASRDATRVVHRPVFNPINYHQQKFSVTADVVYSPNGVTVVQNQAAVDVFVDAAGNIYACNLASSSVVKYAPGSSTGVVVAGGNGLGSAPNQLNSPNGIYVDAAGNIYIADLVNERIQKWAPGASAGVTVAGGNGTGSAPNQFYFPTDVFVDPAGNIYVSDVYNDRIQKWAPGATAGVTVAGGNGPGQTGDKLFHPGDVVVDANGNIYIADTDNNRIQIWTPGATAGYTVAGGGSPGQNAAQLANPNKIFVDKAGNIFVSDHGNYRIQKWAPGAITGVTVAGGNGQGTAANQLSSPWGIFIDAASNLYVADIGNSRIQKFSEGSVPEVIPCPANLAFVAPSCDGRATIQWKEPADTFPATFEAPVTLDAGKGVFTYLGKYNGHGYYISANNYLWRSARDLARSIGGARVDGHLVTLNSASENNFVYGKIKAPGYSPWIGLFNTGTPGRFRWVHGEGLTYTNWAPGEPNNSGGTATTIKEPYVRMSNLDGRWNDQPDERLRFVAEFEQPLIRYRQISGPRNGSMHKPGVYQVCYERTNLVTGKKDKCCFSITISCNATLVNEGSNSSANTTVAENDFSKSLRILTAPNPSHTYFRLKFTGNTAEQLGLKVSDISGRILDVRSKLDPKQTIDLGRNLRPGIYFVQVTQGKKQAVVKIVKE